MSTRGQKPQFEIDADTAGREPICPSDDAAAADGSAGPQTVAHLQTIHDLVRSGHYHVPAKVIADRMIEQLLTEKRGRKG